MARDKGYQTAEMKIEEARRTNATELDLCIMMLTEVPESVSELTQLQRLHLGGNKLATLPEWLGRLT